MFRKTLPIFALAIFALVACGDSDESAQAPPGDVSAAAQPTAADRPSSPAPKPAAPAAEPSAPTDAGATGEEIDPDSLGESGSVYIKQYQAAFIGSGTLGKGTLTYEGREVPFRIGGLGLGGFGVAAIDATGTVYNLSDVEQFPGTYGNARLGITAADAGQGRLWLKNTNGVVIKLWTDMKGLALTGGVDGILIEWESEVQESVRDMKDGARGALDAMKKPFQ